MTLKENPHVARLHRYLPFDPAHDQIYEEYQRSNDALKLPTQALNYMLLVAGTGARLIILTGDAGHGKTHLCRRLLEEHLGYSQDDARSLLNTKCSGRDVIPPTTEKPSNIPLRIFKDFSEIAVEEAVRNIEDAPKADREVVIICANEGRLRAVLESESAGPHCWAILEHFQESFEDGLASRDNQLHIINLNFQSVAARESGGLLGQALAEWLGGNRWRTCQDCDASAVCPILKNRNMLAAGSSSQYAALKVDEQAPSRRRNLMGLFATAERLGVVITIREMLMAVAYMTTGSLSCNDVHRQMRKPSGWQSAHIFYNCLFELPRTVKQDHAALIPVLGEMARLDPGKRAMRSIDEKLVNGQRVFPEGELDLEFSPQIGGDRLHIDAARGIDGIVANARNRKERSGESEFVTKVVRALRRRYFFEAPDGAPALLNQLGFEHGQDFASLLRTGDEVSPARMTGLKSKVLAGLHVMQGLQMRNETHLHLVDPAFGQATTHAAIIAKRIAKKHVQLFPMSERWGDDVTRNEFSMTNSVDWIERCVVLRIAEPGTPAAHLLLDLKIFDWLCRAGTGCCATSFYDYSRRRVSNFLGRLAEQDRVEDSEIALYWRGMLQSVSIDDGVIQVGGRR